MRALLLAGAALAALAAPARASDHQNLDEGLPTSLRDAYAVRLNTIEMQGAFGYSRARSGNGRDAYSLEPRIEWGAARDLQLTFRVPYTVGNDDRRADRGLGGASALYNFNQEGVFLPAFAVEGEVAERFGNGGGTGTQTTLTGIATKTLGGFDLRRVHLNVGWNHLYDPDPEERRNRYTVVAGYSQAIDTDTVLILDYVRQQQDRGQRDANIVEVGLRRQITPRTVVSAGVGAGIGRDSPAIAVTIGIQHSLSWPPSR